MVLKRLQTQALACINCIAPRLRACLAIRLRLSCHFAKPIEITQSGMPRPAWLVLTVLLLTACTPNSDSEFAVYRDRLGRTLKLELPTPDPLKAPLSEANSIAAVAITDIRFELLNMLALDSCGLQPNKPSLGNLIAERNSSLGKVMTYSTQLQYEIKLLQALEACITDEQAPADLRETLKQTYHAKTATATGKITEFSAIGYHPSPTDFWQSAPVRFNLRSSSRNSARVAESDCIKAAHSKQGLLTSKSN